MQENRRYRVPLHRHLRETRILVLLSAPLIYAVVLPLVLLDLFLSVYQAVCFPIYGVARVSRGDHFVFDRAKLAYLNLAERFNCLYCSYASGLISFAREIASRTEQYWCPIKHDKPTRNPHDRYPHFVHYGDAARYRRDLEVLRTQLASADAEHGGRKHVVTRRVRR